LEKEKKRAKKTTNLGIIVNKSPNTIVEKHTSAQFTTPWTPITIKEVDGHILN